MCSRRRRSAALTSSHGHSSTRNLSLASLFLPPSSGSLQVHGSLSYRPPSSAPRARLRACESAGELQLLPCGLRCCITETRTLGLRLRRERRRSAHRYAHLRRALHRRRQSSGHGPSCNDDVRRGLVLGGFNDAVGVRAGAHICAQNSKPSVPLRGRAGHFGTTARTENLRACECRDRLMTRPRAPRAHTSSYEPT
ncbi:hypothetical protein FA95DRAFT_350020 [Auriscalpium vulgare]|uniref:Uncharacterized protein n=1 Tax=Auriscalpium vulgare TaxID=40419 RepID=A0ACB8S4E9_9AGAM|nr:hypothetical protein FA95DRAFT_350020 [Auriscalpium vulgare]